MEAYRTETELAPGGELVLKGLPFPPGKRLEIIVLPAKDQPRQAGPFPLRGSSVVYSESFDPFGPAVPPEDWEACR